MKINVLKVYLPRISFLTQSWVQIIASTVLGSIEHRYWLRILPLKITSDATLDTEIDKISRIMRTTIGYLGVLNFHQIKMSKLSWLGKIGSSKYNLKLLFVVFEIDLFTM